MVRVLYIDSTDDNFISKGETLKDVTHEAEVYQQCGFSHLPEKDTEGIIIPVGKGCGNYIVIASKNRNGSKPSEAGETVVYSIKDGAVKAKTTYKTDGSVKTENDNGYHELKDNGDVEINGNADNAVAYNDLKQQFDELNGKYNKLIGVLNAWVPVPNDGGAVLKGAITSATPLNSTADLSSAKVSTVKLP